MSESNNCIQDIIPLTFLQKCMLIKVLKDSENDCYFEQCHYILEGEIHTKLIEQSWLYVIQAHDALRGKIIWEKVREPIFVIYTKYYNMVIVHDLRHVAEKQEYIRIIKKKNWEHKVKLNTGPFQLTLLWTQNNQLHLIIDTHHCIIDGWSNALILKEFFMIYNALCQKKEWCLPTYRLRNLIFQNSIEKTEASKFWHQYLADYHYEKNQPYVGADTKDYYRVPFSDELYNKISKLVVNKKILFSTVFYGAWALMQKKKVNKQSVVFGVTFSGRKALCNHIEEAVGVFINTVPLRVNTDITGIELLKQINSDLISISSIQHISFLELSAEMGMKINGMFDTTIVIQNYPIDNCLQSQQDLPYKLSLVSTKYSPPANLTIGFLDLNKKALEFFYNPVLYDRQEIINIGHNYVRTISQIIQQINEFL